MSRINLLKNKIFFLIIYLFSPYIFGEITSFLKIYFKRTGLNIFYDIAFPFICYCMWIGCFFVFMTFFNNKIITFFRHGKVIGFIGVSILPFIWGITLALSTAEIANEGYSSFILSRLLFIFSDQQILSYYIILMTIIAFNNFTNRAHGLIMNMKGGK